MFTPEQFNSFLGPNFKEQMELPLRLDIPVDESRVQGLNEFGARKARTTWEQDSARLELMVDCQYPTILVSQLATMVRRKGSPAPGNF